MINASVVSTASALEIHWGNVGSFIGGVAAVALAVIAIISGAAGLKDWRAKQRQLGELAEEQAREIRLHRQSALQAWSPGGVATYDVKLVTDPDEMRQATKELTAHEPSVYVVRRVSESGNDVNRADSLRNLIERDGRLSRAPSPDEIAALEEGRRQLLTAEDGKLPSAI